MERLALEQNEFTVAKIDRYEGYFEKARQRLTPPSKEDVRLAGVSACNRISQLAAVHCELGENGLAEGLLRQEIKFIDEVGLNNTPSARCLQLTLAEVLLAQSLPKDAEDLYLKIGSVVQDCDYNTPTRIAHLRMCVGLARASHMQGFWPGALNLWGTALIASEACDWRAGFIEMVIRYSMSHVKSVLDGRNDIELI